MEQVFERPLTVGPSVADSSGRLSVHDAFGLFMDIATAHAEALGVGLAAMTKRNLFWLTVKTQIRFSERPRIMAPVTLRTWPEAPGRVRALRSYQLLRDGEVLIAGKTEWAVLNTETKQFAPMEEVYPAALQFDRESACPGPFARIPDAPDAFESFADYRVRSTDIDVGGHCNNAAYVRALLGGLSNEELRAMNVRRMDVVFRSPCYEGEALTFQRRPTETGLDLRIAKADGSTALLARMERG